MILIPEKVKKQLKKRWWWYILEFSIFALVLTLDLVSKHLLVEVTKGDQSYERPLIPKLLSLTYAKNTGGAFSALSGSTTFLSVITSLLLIGIGIFLILDLKQGLEVRIPLILIVGGGLGNLVDRIKFEYVRDFFKFSFDWGIFNIADVFISHGAIILVIVLIVQLVKEFKKGKKKGSVSEIAENQKGSEELVSLEKESELDENKQELNVIDATSELEKEKSEEEKID